MRNDRKEWLQQRAYAIWESEGHPAGREREHWQQAERELAAHQAPPQQIAVDATPADAAATLRKRAAKKSSAPATARTGKKKAAELRP